MPQITGLFFVDKITETTVITREKLLNKRHVLKGVILNWTEASTVEFVLAVLIVLKFHICISLCSFKKANSMINRMNSEIICLSHCSHIILAP